MQGILLEQTFLYETSLEEYVRGTLLGEILNDFYLVF